MSIENYLERIAVSLEKLANVTDETPKKPVATKPEKKATKAAPSKPTKSKSPPKEEASTGTGSSDEGATLTDVRKALAGLQKRVDAAAAKAVLKITGGAATLSKLDPDRYQAVIDAAAE